MKFGMPTLIEFKSIEDAAKLASKAGLSFVELNMNLPYCTIEALHNTDLKRMERQYGVSFTLHADENLFFCDFSHRVAQAHLENMLDAIGFAKENNISLINFHMSRGVYFTLPEGKKYLFEEYQEVYTKRLLHFRNLCEKEAAGEVKLCIENTGIREHFVQNGVDLLLGSPSFALTWDVGHDYSAGCADRQFLMRRKERIFHMHLHDSRGKECHLPLGEGDMDWLTCMKLAAPQRCVIEVKTAAGLKASLPALKQHFPSSFQ